MSAYRYYLPSSAAHAPERRGTVLARDVWDAAARLCAHYGIDEVPDGTLIVKLPDSDANALLAETVQPPRQGNVQRLDLTGRSSRKAG